MKDKFVALISSPRFIGLLVVGLLQALVLFNVITGAQGEGLVQIVQAVIAGTVVIRTIDRNTGDSAVEAAKAVGGVTTVTIPESVTSVTASTK